MEKEIVVVETREQFEFAMSRLQGQRAVSIDTETAGKEAVRLWKRVAELSSQLFLFQERLARLKHVYKARYKQRCLKTRAKIHDLQETIKNYNSEIREAKTKADRNPGGLDFYLNELACVQIGTDHAANNGIGTAYLIRPEAIDAAVLREFVATREEVLLHNAKFDYKMLKHHLAIELQMHNLVDTQAREYVLTMGTKQKIGLDACLRKYCGTDKDKSVRLQNWAGEWTEQMMEYAAGDVLYLFDVARSQDTQLESCLMDTVFLEQDLAIVLGDMELEGIGIDKELATVAAKYAESELAQHEEDVKNLLPGLSNPNSNQQLLEALRNRGHKLNNVDVKAIRSLGDVPYAKAILKMREFGKVLSTYYVPLRDSCVLTHEGTSDEHYRIFANFNAVGRGDDDAGTDTGRLSSSNPNLQNQPAKKRIPLADGSSVLLRAIFVPRPGWSFVHVDLPQIEPRILAHITQDPVLLRAFQDDLDVYCLMGEMMTGRSYADIVAEYEAGDKTLRDRMKIALLSVMYGKSAFSLAKENGWLLIDAMKFLSGFFRKFLRIKRWAKMVIKTTKQQGYLDNIAGARRYFPGIKDDDKKKVAHYERAACNFDIQGPAAKGMKASLVFIWKSIRAQGLQDDVKLILTVHDEVVVEARNDAVVQERALAIVKDGMERGTGQFIPTVPLTVVPTIIPTWAEGKAA